MRRHRLTPYDIAREELKLELQKAGNALESAYSVFENVTDPDLIDCAIYQINAIQLKYKYLLERARQYSPDNVSPGECLCVITAPSKTATDIYKYSELVI